MKRFAELFRQIDQTNRSGEKLAALERYFREAPPRDAAWALHVLYGRKLMRAISYRRVSDWLAEATGLPSWLIAESYDAVGDGSETIALLQPEGRPPSDEPLHLTIEARLLPLSRMSDDQQRQIILQAWRDFDSTQVFLFHKLMSQTFRIGVARKGVINALAAAAGVDPAVMAHRLLSNWKPTAEDYLRLIRGDGGHADVGHPYPFYLAHPLEEPVESLGDPSQWQIEWKWDGIRAQLIRRGGQTMLWSRGEELITDGFPELVAAADDLHNGTVLDGEVLAWENDAPLPFQLLQRRINRKNVAPMLFADVPVVFMAYDLLEQGGEDLRERSLTERRSRLERLLPDGESLLRVSPIVAIVDWSQLQQLMATSRQRGVEGVMLKRKDSPYHVGRLRGDWWKWKVDPFTVDAVLIYAQQGSGKRASLFTDYTFGVWPPEGAGKGELIPVAKAYSGLDDEEIHQVDAWVRQHTTGRSGPVRFVEPKLVFELAFEGIAESTRHKAGLALRFPRMARWRHDKPPEEADTLETLRALHDQQQRRMDAPTR